MSKTFTVSREDILHQVKISCQIPSFVDEIVTRKLVLSTATELGIKVEPEELQKAADNIRLMSQLKSADETWAWLQKHCLSIDDFQELVYSQLVSGKLAQHLFADQVEPWFVEHQLNYVRAVLYEVVLEDEDLAMELFYALQEEDMTFPEVAHQYIQDNELRRRGGYQGIVPRQQLKPEVSAAVFAAKPPQVLKPIVTSKGVHLILVEELIQPQLDEQLRHKIIADLFRDWVKKQMDAVEIISEINAEST